MHNFDLLNFQINSEHIHLTVKKAIGSGTEEEDFSPHDFGTEEAGFSPHDFGTAEGSSLPCSVPPAQPSALASFPEQPFVVASAMAEPQLLLADEDLDWRWAVELGDNQRHFSGLMHSIKSYFWHQVHEDYGFTGKFWAGSCYYRVVDTERYFRNTVNYVRNNWLKHHLPEKFSRSPYFYQNGELICRYL